MKNKATANKNRIPTVIDHLFMFAETQEQQMLRLVLTIECVL